MRAATGLCSRLFRSIKTRFSSSSLLNFLFVAGFLFFISFPIYFSICARTWCARTGGGGDGDIASLSIDFLHFMCTYRQRPPDLQQPATKQPLGAKRRRAWQGARRRGIQKGASLRVTEVPVLLPPEKRACKSRVKVGRCRQRRGQQIHSTHIYICVRSTDDECTDRQEEIRNCTNCLRRKSTKNEETSWMHYLWPKNVASYYFCNRFSVAILSKLLICFTWFGVI